LFKRYDMFIFVPVIVNFDLKGQIYKEMFTPPNLFAFFFIKWSVKPNPSPLAWVGSSRIVKIINK